MNDKPELRIYESYLCKSKEFFSFLKKKPRQKFELSAVSIGFEENHYVTLTDLITPDLDKILITTNDELKNLESRVIKQYELITTRDHSMLTEAFVKKLNNQLQGREHNHPCRREIPTVGDIIRISQCRQLMKPIQKYFIEIIHLGLKTNIFYYPVDLLSFIYRTICSYGIKQARLEAWLQANKEALLINDYEVIKGK